MCAWKSGWERTRIARELHDTLLQSFQGSLFGHAGGSQHAFPAPRRSGANSR